MDIAASATRGAASTSPEGEPHLLRARLARVKGQRLLFSATRKAIYGLNESAADIWYWLEQGAGTAEAERQLTEGGLDPLTAKRHVRDAVDEWRRLGLLLPHRAALLLKDCLVSRSLAMPDVRVRLSCSRAHAEAVMAPLRHLEAPADAADVDLELIEDGSQLHLFRNGAWLSACSPEEAPPALRAQLLAEVLDHGCYELALHAASMAVGDRLLLLCGPPGAGKTTLSLGLARAGFGYCSDDVTLLDASALCTAVALAPAVKRGAWRLLRPSCPGLAGVPIFRRPDGRQVRYPVPGRVERSRPRCAAWIVLLDRRPGERARLQSADPVAVMRCLLADAFARERHLTDTAFDALVRAVEGAEIGRLVYDGLEGAVRALRDWCR